MSVEMWDDRYGASELVWSTGPNVWVAELAGDLPPGRALDLAAGEGRNALWLAERGWETTAVDFSQVALDRATELAAGRLGDAAGRFHVQRADLLTYTPEREAFDLVLVVYLQIPAEERWMALRAAAVSVAPGGRLMVIAHDSTNLEHGYGGPQDPAVLYTAADVAEDLEGSGLGVAVAETRARQVVTGAGTHDALDAVVVAVRPAVAQESRT